MKRKAPRAAIVTALTTAALLGGSTAAHATATVTFTDGSFAAAGDGANDTVIAKDGSQPFRVAIQVPGQALADPDGVLGAACTSSGDTAECEEPDSVSLNGNGGADVLTDSRTLNGPFGSSVTLDGGDGNDTITGGPSRDTIFPGRGADRVRGGNAPTDPNAEPYKGFIAGGGRPADFQRDFGPDQVSFGSAGPGVTVTLDDQANDGAPGEGDDIGSDVEAVDGTDANDTLTAGGAAVDFRGALGDDTLNGGPADDSLSGGSGFLGGNGSGSGSDALNGGGGDDFLTDDDASPFQAPLPGDPPPTPAGTDRLNGGDGDDNLRADAGPDDLVGGPGRDRASFSRSTPFPAMPAPDFRPTSAGFTISLDDQANDGQTSSGEGDNVHSDVEDVDTSSFDDFGSGGGDDVITGSAAPNELFTGSGKDSVTVAAVPTASTPEVATTPSTCRTASPIASTGGGETTVRWRTSVAGSLKRPTSCSTSRTSPAFRCRRSST